MSRVKKKHSSRGVSLLEVIACTALVTILIVPIAGVIRASGKSIAEANGPTTTESELRKTARWIAATIRSNTVVAIRRSQLQLQWESGDTATIRLERKTLVLEDASGQSVLADNVQRIRFATHRQASPPRKTTGVTLVLQKRDPKTRRLVSVEDTVAIPTQF